MTRKGIAAYFCLVSLAAQLYRALQWGTLPGLGAFLWWLPDAFLMPGELTVIIVQRIFHMTKDWNRPSAFLLALAFWFFPVSRVERWFGTFDAFTEPRFRLPSIARGAATILDTLNRWRVGKGKMGGWA